MLRRRAAAAAHQGQAVVAHEALVGVAQLLGRQRIVGAVLAEHREPRVGHAGDRHARVLREVAQVLAHLGGTRGAVEADHVDAQRLQRRERRADLRAQQHGPGRLDRHRADQRQVVGAGRLLRAAGADDRGLRLKEVLGGLHQQGVGAAGDHSLGVLLVGVAQRGVRGVAQRRQFRARAHRAQHPAGAAVGLELVRDVAGDARALLREFEDALGDLVLPQRRVVGAEGVGLHAVHTGFEVLGVDGPHDVGAGHVEDLVAAFELLEVVETGVLRLNHRAHRAVRDDHALLERFPQGGCPREGGCGRTARRGHEGFSLECDGCRLCAVPSLRRGRRT